MNPTKIKLSTTELDLVTNANFILTKNAIIGKVVDTFSFNASHFKDTISNTHLPNEVIQSSPKIAKGENYLGLPWVILDYPRVFNTQDAFAIRTFFWWGNFISITLQLSGKYQAAYQQQLFNNLAAMPNNNWQLCCNTTAWQHHFKSTNYQPFNSFSNQALQYLPFIKLAKKIPLQEWDNMDIFLQENFKNLLQLLTTQTVK
jgi:hypothetical protein